MTTRSPAFASIPESIQWSPPLRETSCVRRSFPPGAPSWAFDGDRKSTRLNSSHDQISYAVFCLKKKKKREQFRSALIEIHRHSALEQFTDTVPSFNSIRRANISHEITSVYHSNAHRCTTV